MKKYVANIVHDNLATEDIKLGLSIFKENLHRAGVGLRVVHVTEDHVVYEPFIISWDAPISLKTIDGEVTTLKLSMPIYGLPFEQKKAVIQLTGDEEQDKKEARDAVIAVASETGLWLNPND